MSGLSDPRASKSTGRPLAAYTVAVREAILELPAMGYEQMTVRGMFYVLESLGVVKKTEQGYRKVQRQTVKLRREGLLPWSFVADLTRWRRVVETWDSVEDALRDVSRTYRRNRWRSQRKRIEVWLEKDALAGLVSEVTYRYGVSLMVSRGQSSETFIYEAAREAAHAWDRAGIETIVLALYDADSYGRDAAAKIREKLAWYAPHVPISFELVALTDEQVAEFDLPTRFDKKERGRAAVELDALQVLGPGTLEGILSAAINKYVDLHVWEQERIVEDSERRILETIVGRGAA